MIGRNKIVLLPVMAYVLTRLFLLVGIGFFVCAGQNDADIDIESQVGRAIKCYRGDGSAQRCMPAFENIAFGKNVNSNNTCGKPRRQYCVQTGTSGAKKTCDFCDASQAGYNHPPYLMTDIVSEANPTWWQSQTLLDNKYPVRLIMNFEKTYEVLFIRIKFHTIRPHSFAIFKKSSYDPNEQWTPYQYYSRTCQQTYGLPNNEIVKISNQKIALCSDEFSSMTPLSGGNVAFLTLRYRPGKNNFDDHTQLQDFVTVSSLRFDLDRLNTFGDEVFGDPKVLRSYYFAISNIAVGGRCKCNGHASACDTVKGILQCKCEHNTAGIDCEKCLPLFNDRPWRKGSGKSANPCIRCTCNGLADSCIFDKQLWTDSRGRSGGRCLNCKNNTAGINCEKCKDFHYRSDQREACKPCKCNNIGARSLNCNDKGKCACKPGVTGQKCDRCYPGYYGFSKSGCRACGCSYEGSLSQNCDATGQCRCKPNVVGKRCDQCQANHFDLDGSNPSGCKPCFCNGHGISCTALPGIGRKEIVSSFQTGLDGWKVVDEYGVDRTSLAEKDRRSQYVYIRSPGKQKLYFLAPGRYLGNRLSSYAKLLTFKYGIFRQPNDEEVESSTTDIVLEGSGMTASYAINSQNNPLPKDRFVTYNFRLVEPKGVSTFDFQRILSDLKALKIRVTYLSGRRGAIDRISLESTQYLSVNSPEQVTWQESCTCEQGYKGNLCEQCSSGYTRVAGATSPLGKCVLCECNNHGDQCDPETGICECKDNTTGHNCEICKAGFYGNPTRGNPDDCKPCPCVFGSNCILIGSSVQCTNCPEGHIGDRCEVCKDGYFGDPLAKLGMKTRCQLCDCSGNVDPNAFGNCDGLTGACIKCINNTTNGKDNRCELCADGYFGDALKGNCSACNCYTNGTFLPPNHKAGDLLPCDVNGKCKCRKNVIGDQCNSCPPGFWNVASGNGCEPCSCDPLGSHGTECNVDSGQCLCKAGVGGRRCDRCAAGHYRFSKSGCKACSCNPDGSVDQNCTEFGVCVCKENVLGIKCDKCPENKFNLTAGCLSCPACFDLIEEAVNNLREQLHNFNFTINVNGSSGSIIADVKDKDFEKAINLILKDIILLITRVKTINREDKEVNQLFLTLKSEFDGLELRLDELKKMIKKTKDESQNGKERNEDAGKIIENIMKLFDQLDTAMDTTVTQIKKRAETNAGNLSVTGKEMLEIARQAGNAAATQYNESLHIVTSTKKAVNQSTAALKASRNAREAQKIIIADLTEKKNQANESSSRIVDAKGFIKYISKKFSEVSGESDVLVEEAKKSLIDLGEGIMKDYEERSLPTLVNITTTTLQLVNDNSVSVENLGLDEISARELMSFGKYLKKQSSIARQKSITSKTEAEQAQADGLKTLDDANNMLKILKEFDERIEESRKNASEIKRALIEPTKKLLKAANNLDLRAKTEVEEALTQAIRSLNAIEEGNNTIANAEMAIDDVKASLKDLLERILAFSKVEVRSTMQHLNKTSNALDKYRKRAEEDFVGIKASFNDSQMALKYVASTKIQLNSTFRSVSEISSKITSLQDIDSATLNDAESRLKDAANVIENSIQNEIERLTLFRATQQANLRKYTAELGPLRAMIDEANAIFDNIPRACFKREVVIEPGAAGAKN